MAGRTSAARAAATGRLGTPARRGEPTPSLKSLDPRAAQWIGALIRMTSGHPAMTRILDVIDRLQERPYRTNAVLLGEPGTGKEGLARALHQLMDLRGPMVRFDPSGLPEELALEALCGHHRTPGAAEAADGGTLLIEEAAALGPRVQVALLRLLKSGRCERAGARDGDRRFVVNAVALSDRDLPAEVAAGRFRHDLYYRLARIVLWLPPLRERLEDIGPSAVWMGNRILRAAGLPHEVRTSEDLRRAPTGERAAAIELEPGAVEALRRHEWPGNFRELEAVLERALLLYRQGPRLGAAEVRAALEGSTGTVA